MTQAEAFPVRIETEHAGDGPEVVRAGLFCFGLSAAILAVGTVWLGRAGMFEPRSPDFFPLPDFVAFASAALGAFLTVRGVLRLQRFGKFGTSVFECYDPVLGEALSGRLRTAADIKTQGSFTLRLRCDCRSMASSFSGDSHARNQIGLLWESVQTVPGETRTSLGIPVSFGLPANGLPSGQRPKPKTGVHPEGPERIEWTLRVSAPLRGLDYVAEFPLKVRSGKVMAVLARQAGPEPVDTASTCMGPMATAGEGAGLAALELATLFIGGHVPTADENAAEARANAAVEPDRPFQGEPTPEQQGAKWARVIGLVGGTLLCAIGAFALATQISYGLRADHLTGVVTAVEKNRLLLALDGSGAAARSYVSGMRHWEVGQQVALACTADGADPRRCRADTGCDRWLDGLGTLVVGLGALAVGLNLRRRQAPKR